METRRIRRHERRRTRRTALAAASVVVIGIAVGTALPHSIPISIALLAVAACCLTAVAIDNPAIAPLHGLHRVVRLPLRTSAAVTFESFASRLVGTARAFVGRLQPRPIVVDEPDDEAEQWWGATAAPPAVEPAPSAPPALAPWPPAPPPAPPLPAPVLAAPMPSAHVTSADAYSLRAWLAQLGMHARRWFEPLTRRTRRATGEASAST